MRVMSFCLLFLLLSCAAPKVIPLKGNYPTQPIEITSNKNFDELWDKLIDVFAQKGLSIKIIDRSSGLVVSDRSLLPATIEDKNGNLMDPAAYIVVPKIYNKVAKRFIPITKIITGPYVSKSYVDKADPVSGDWNVRIKKTNTGTVINVNIVNITYTSLENKIQKETILQDYKSTGVFERTLADLIK